MRIQTPTRLDLDMILDSKSNLIYTKCIIKLLHYLNFNYISCVIFLILS